MKIPFITSALIGCLLALVTISDTAQPQAPCPVATLPAYSHNDYTNARPLLDALELGFRGIEADVFLVDGVLRVGHDRQAATRAETFEHIYLAPLEKLIARCGLLRSDGVPFLVTLEFKETSPAGYAELARLLARYEPLFNGAREENADRAPVEIVLVGWVPVRDTLEAEPPVRLFRQYRILRRPDVGLLRQLDSDVRLVSVDYGKTLGRWWVTRAGRRRWLADLTVVKRAAPDRLLRVYNVPATRAVYEALLKAGVDLIGTKHLARTAALLRARPGS